MNFDFTGKTAVVTGGSRGIGAAVSVLFASCGANVMIDHLPVESDLEGLRRVEEEIRKGGGVCASFAGDVSCPEAMEKLCREAVSRFEGLDILVNCAGFTRPARAAELSADLWARGVEVNLD